jgi:hypothetical protein
MFQGCNAASACCPGEGRRSGVVVKRRPAHLLASGFVLYQFVILSLVLDDKLEYRWGQPGTVDGEIGESRVTLLGIAIQVGA